jgi:putative transposase
MAKSQRVYTPEFRRQMVELHRAGRKFDELAKEFGCTSWSIRQWVKQADRDTGRGDGGLSTAERQELTRLRRENRELRTSGRFSQKQRPGLQRKAPRHRSALRIREGEPGHLFGTGHVSFAQGFQERLLRVGRPCAVDAGARGHWPQRQDSRDLSTLARCVGAPTIHAELADEHATRVGRKRVARLMRSAGLSCVFAARYVRTTQADPAADRPTDLVERQFAAEGPDRLWVADITYVPTWAGFLYLAIVLDVWSRRIVGWMMDTHVKSELVLDALDMALAQRRPFGVIHHSDRGCQYTSYAFGKRCQEMGVMPWVGSVGDAYDNAMAESFFATLEREVLNRRRFKTQAEARMAIFEWLEGWYNPHRRHSSLGYLSPINYERKLLTTETAEI